jgi:hypothetical protein
VGGFRKHEAEKMSSILVEKTRLAFISYRRSEADALAGRIKDRMRVELVGWETFMDVDSIEPGGNFRQIIDEALARSSVFVLLIGKSWLGGSASRIHDPEDFVRYEVASALSRNIRIIPVLVNDATMPTARDLPYDIAKLAERNAVVLRHTRFDDDFANLARAIADGPHVRTGDVVSVFNTVRGIGSGALFGLALTISGLIVHFEATGKSASERVGEDGAALLIPACVVIGGVFGYLRTGRKRTSR